MPKPEDDDRDTMKVNENDRGGKASNHSQKEEANIKKRDERPKPTEKDGNEEADND